MGQYYKLYPPELASTTKPNDYLISKVKVVKLDL